MKLVFRFFRPLSTTGQAGIAGNAISRGADGVLLTHTCQEAKAGEIKRDANRVLTNARKA